MAVSLDDIKKMSPQQRLLAVIVFYLLCGYFFYFYYLQADIEKRGNLKTKLEELQKQVATKERLASELGKYLKDVDKLKAAFKTALTKLPIREEIPELLQSVALSGRDAGMNFLLFEPQPSVRKLIGGANTPEQPPGGAKPPAQPAPKPPAQPPAGAKPPDQSAGAKGAPAPPPDKGEYYEEIPVKVIIVGSFYDTDAFFARLAVLPRIINIENITLGDAKTTNGKLVLRISCMIKTYMFVQKPEDTGKKTDAKKP